MTTMTPALDLFIDANILLLLAYVIWRGAQFVMVRGGLRHDYRRQLKLLKSVLVITLVSPLVAYALAAVSKNFLPDTPLTVSDIAVAAYLRGEIALSAADFEAILNSRTRLLDDLVAGNALWVTLLSGAFLGGFAVLTARVLWALWKVRRTLRRSHLLRRTARTEIRVSDTVGVPFAARGLVRRYVVVPSALVTRPRELRLVLAHEFHHLRSSDVEWELAFEFLRPLLYWNPAFQLWKRTFDQLRELSCDQEVVAAYRISPQEYAQCLLDFCERRLSGVLPRAFNVAFVRHGRKSPREVFESRILALYEVPAGRHGGLVLPCMVVILALTVSIAAASIRRPGDWSHDRLMLSTILNLERLEARNRGF